MVLGIVGLLHKLVNKEMNGGREGRREELSHQNYK